MACPWTPRGTQHLVTMVARSNIGSPAGAARTGIVASPWAPPSTERVGRCCCWSTCHVPCDSSRGGVLASPHNVCSPQHVDGVVARTVVHGSNSAASGQSVAVSWAAAGYQCLDGQRGSRSTYQATRWKRSCAMEATGKICSVAHMGGLVALTIVQSGMRVTCCSGTTASRAASCH